MTTKRVSLKRMTLVGWEDDIDLRTVTQNIDFLNEVVKEYRLKDGEGVWFTSRQIGNRPMRQRFVYMLGDLPILLIVPTASQAEMMRSIWLRASEFIREHFSMSGAIRRSLKAAA